MAGERPSLNARRGAVLAFATAAISGLSIYLNSFGVKLVPDAAVYTTAKNGVAAIILIGLALALGAGREAATLLAHVTGLAPLELGVDARRNRAWSGRLHRHHHQVGYEPGAWRRVEAGRVRRADPQLPPRAPQT